MFFDFGENVNWNASLLIAEAVANASIVSGRKKDKENALTHFQRLYSTAKTFEGKIRALVGISLSHYLLHNYKASLTSAQKALELSRNNNNRIGNSACREYLRRLAKETYDMTARALGDSLKVGFTQVHKRKLTH